MKTAKNYQIPKSNIRLENFLLEINLRVTKVLNFDNLMK